MKDTGLELIDPRGSKPLPSNLEVIVIGITPSHPKSPFIYPMLKFLWEDWFTRMGLPKDHLTLVKAGSSTDAKTALEKAISKKR